MSNLRYAVNSASEQFGQVLMAAYPLILRALQNLPDAEDLTQLFFCRVMSEPRLQRYLWECRELIVRHGRLPHYLRRQIRSQAWKVVQRDKQRVVGLTLFAEEARSRLNTSSCRELDERIRKDAYATFLNSLSGRSRAIVERLHAGKTCKEIAEIFAVSPRTITAELRAIANKPSTRQLNQDLFR